jgi:hypothetical protein
MKFKSQICTTMEQSERLLALGLKKETADMHWAYHSVTATRYMVAHPCDGVGESIPAWSLHRLIEIVAQTKYPYRVISKGLPIYDALCERIEWLIKEGYFNKEYLV